MININKKPNNSILILLLFVIFSACIVAGGCWWYGNQKQKTKKTWEEALESIERLKVNQISEWRQERINDALIIGKWDKFINCLQDKPVCKSDGEAIITWFKFIQNLYDYDNIFLLNNKSEIILAANENHTETLNQQTLQLFSESLGARRVILGDFYRCQFQKTVHLDLISPISIRRDNQDEVLGGLIFVIDPHKFLFPLIQSWPTPSSTAETLLVKRDGDTVVFLNELRHTQGTSLNLRRPLTHIWLPAARAVQGREGVWEGEDYRGVSVLTAAQAVPDTPWYMIAKVDKEEIYRPLYRETWLIALGGIFLILLVGAVLGWTISIQRKRHFEELYRLEQERQVLRTHFEYLLKYANDIILLMDQEGNLQEVNDRAMASYGYNREEIMQLNIRDLVPPDETPAFLRWGKEELAGRGKIFEGYHRRRDGSVFPVEVSVNLIQAEGKQYFQEIIRDITERKEAEEALRESEQRYRLLVDNAAEAIVVAQDGFLKFINPASSIVLGHSAVELTSTPFGEFIHPEDRETVRDNHQKRLQGENLSPLYPFRIWDQDGNIRWVELNAVRIDWDGWPATLNFLTNITERKRVEEKFMKEKQVSDTIIDSLPGVFYCFDEQGRFLRWNANFEQATGYTATEFAELTPLDLFAGEDKNLIARAIQEAFLRGTNTAEAELVTKEGSRVPYYFTGRRLDLDGIPCLIGMGIDITARRQAEAALVASEERFRHISSTSSDISYSCTAGPDGSYSINWMAGAVEDIIGYTVEEIKLQRCWRFLVIEEDQPLFEKQVSSLSPGSSSICELRLRHKNGGIIWVNSCAECVKDTRQPENIHLYGGLVDITKRKQVEEAFRVLVNNAPIGIFILQDGKFKMINPGFTKICGYSEEELIGRNSLQRVLSDYQEQVRQKVIWMLKGQSHLPFEFPIVTKSGETKWVLEKIAPTVYQGQRAALGYFLDISEHKSLESQFLQAQKLESVGRLAGGVAHDFNNMLGVIQGYTDMALEKLSAQDPVHKYQEEIKSAAQRSAALVRQLLAYARKQVISPIVLDMNDTISGLLKMLQRLIGEDIDLVWMPGHNLWKVMIDPSQIDQLLANLMVNARDAIAGVGKVTIETDNVTLDENYCADHDCVPGDYVLLAVSDDGCGMDNETLAQIFEPFFTTKELGKGTGLGLSTVYGVVKQNDGNIQVYSEIGQGTTFKVYLPRVQEAVSAIPTAPPPAEGLYGWETILAVEDEDMLRELISLTLEMYGYTALMARHGGEALLLSERHDGTIHLLLTDVVMPQMSGRDLAERLAPLRPDMKVLYMSGYTKNVVVHHGVLDSTVSFLQKPFSPQTLVEKIRQILDKAVR